MPSAFSKHGLALDLIGPGWSIPKNAKHADAAAKWVNFFTKEENLNVFLKVEGAYSPYTNEKSNMPELATLYTQARNKGSLIIWPFSSLEFPKPLQSEWEDSLTGFLLNLDAPNKKTLQRWDETIEDDF